MMNEPVLTHAEALALSDRLFALLDPEEPGVTIEHTARSIVKVTNGRVLSSHDGDEVSIHFGSIIGGGIPVAVGTNQLNDASLRAVIAQVKARGPQRASLAGQADEPDAQLYLPREHMQVDLWHEATISALDTIRSDILPGMMTQIASSGFNCVATIGVVARATLYRYRSGLTAWARETDSEVSVTARATDGRASGWGGWAARDWSVVGTAGAKAVVNRAVETARRSQGMVAFEPGRYMAILSATAVAQLVARMPYMFDAYTTDVMGGQPFSLRDGTARRNKLGMRVIDSRLTMSTDPSDPVGGVPPFFEAGGLGLPGLPITATTWIDHGILRNLAYNPSYAAERGKGWNELPYAVRLQSVAGTTQTVEEMIASCQFGILVNRFSDISLVDGGSGLMTGVTRDGCFLVRNGKIEKPLKNFRFLESPLFAFNKVLAIGTPERAAFGYAPPPNVDFHIAGSWPPVGRDRRWPLAPVIAPPMMVSDFSFATLVDAV